MMMRRWKAAALFGSLAACSSSGSGGSASDATKFVGKWVYQSGSSFSFTCPGQPAMSNDLSAPAPGAPPESFTLSAGMQPETIHEVDSLGCAFDFTVSGNTATGTAGQSCDKLPNGMGGTTTMSFDSLTMATSDGKTITVTYSGKYTPGMCPATLTGTAVKQ